MNTIIALKEGESWVEEIAEIHLKVVNFFSN